MTTPADPEPASPTPAPHRAPPSDDRPRSKLALWSLITALVLSFLGGRSGLVLLVLPALGLAVWAVLRIKPATQRGHGIAVLALVVSLMGASCSYFGAVGMRDTVGALGRGALAALASENEPQRLDDWLTKGAREDGAADRIRRRFEAVTALFGPYEGEIVEESLFKGSIPYAPVDLGTVDEIGAEEDEPRREGWPFWARARFRDGLVRLELLIEQDFAAMQRIHMSPGEDRKPEVLEDLRFYVDKPGD